MDPKSVPSELQDPTIVEQQLISRISPAINIHMLKHGGIASSGHCVTFPQQINEPATDLPKLPSEINILKVKRKGKMIVPKNIVLEDTQSKMLYGG